MHEVNHTLRNTVDIVLCILMMQVELLNKQVAQMINRRKIVFIITNL